MELWEYMAQAKFKDPSFTNARFADMIGAHRSRIGRIMRYIDPPSVPIAIEIEKATKGQVDVWDLLKRCYKQKNVNLTKT